MAFAIPASREPARQIHRESHNFTRCRDCSVLTTTHRASRLLLPQPLYYSIGFGICELGNTNEGVLFRCPKENQKGQRANRVADTLGSISASLVLEIIILHFPLFIRGFRLWGLSCTNAPAAAARLMCCYAAPRELCASANVIFAMPGAFRPALAVRLRWPQARIMIHWIIFRALRATRPALGSR